jgi:hypothetical protein
VSTLVPFRVYGVNNSNGKTWRKIAMIMLVKGEGWMEEVLALQGLKHPNPKDKFARE